METKFSIADAAPRSDNFMSVAGEKGEKNVDEETPSKDTLLATPTQVSALSILDHCNFLMC